MTTTHSDPRPGLRSWSQRTFSLFSCWGRLTCSLMSCSCCCSFCTSALTLVLSLSLCSAGMFPLAAWVQRHNSTLRKKKNCHSVDGFSKTDGGTTAASNSDYIKAGRLVRDYLYCTSNMSEDRQHCCLNRCPRGRREKTAQTQTHSLVCYCAISD